MTFSKKNKVRWNELIFVCKVYKTAPCALQRQNCTAALCHCCCVCTHNKLRCKYQGTFLVDDVIILFSGCFPTCAHQYQSKFIWTTRVHEPRLWGCIIIHIKLLVNPNWSPSSFAKIESERKVCTIYIYT